MGRVSIKTQITRKSIGKIDNQMSSGIELEIVAIHQPVVAAIYSLLDGKVYGTFP